MPTQPPVTVFWMCVLNAKTRPPIVQGKGVVTICGYIYSFVKLWPSVLVGEEKSVANNLCFQSFAPQLEATKHRSSDCYSYLRHKEPPGEIVQDFL